MKTCFLFLLNFSPLVAVSAIHPVFQGLSVGQHPVGFSIVSITDSTRVHRPNEYTIWESDPNQRFRNIVVHLWYPARHSSSGIPMTLEDYAISNYIPRTGKMPAFINKTAILEKLKEELVNHFGTFNDSTWKKMLKTPCLATAQAETLNKRFPLLIGMLRPFSTTITNEILASHGYVIAMVSQTDRILPYGYMEEVADMQRVISYLSQTGMTEENSTGSYGFSGSGFSQLLLAMHDRRIRALADLESAYYGIDLLRKSNLYQPEKLRIPFLHIYGRGLAGRDRFFEDFHRKKYADRYHLEITHDKHHWDMATEGRISSTLLHNRENEKIIRSNFEIVHYFLLHFFNMALRKDENAAAVMSGKNNPHAYADSFYSLNTYPAGQAPLDKDGFLESIRKESFGAAMQKAEEQAANDPGMVFPGEPYTLLRFGEAGRLQKKYEEAFRLVRLGAKLFPEEPEYRDLLAVLHEDSGNREEALRLTEELIDELGKKGGRPRWLMQKTKSRLERLKITSPQTRNVKSAAASED